MHVAASLHRRPVALPSSQNRSRAEIKPTATRHPTPRGASGAARQQACAAACIRQKSPAAAAIAPASAALQPGPSATPAANCACSFARRATRYAAQRCLTNQLCILQSPRADLGVPFALGRLGFRDPRPHVGQICQHRMRPCALGHPAGRGGTVLLDHAQPASALPTAGRARVSARCSHVHASSR